MIPIILRRMEWAYLYKMNLFANFPMAYLFYHSWLGGGAEAKNRKNNDAATVNSLSHVLFVGLWLWTAAINNT